MLNKYKNNVKMLKDIKFGKELVKANNYPLKLFIF